MFSLYEQTAKLANLNLRAELHGEETNVAVDLKIEAKMSNDVLSEFDPDLKSSFYKKDADAAQAELIDDPSRLAKLKFPKMAPLKYGYEGAGYEAVINWGVSGKDDVRLLQVKIDGFRFDRQDGGTVGLSFRAIAHPTPEEIGRLSELVQREITLSLYPPSPEEQLKQQMDALDDEDDE